MNIKGQLGYCSENVKSTTYGTKARQDFIDDALTVGMTIRESGDTIKALNNHGLISGEWQPKVGGTLAWDV